VNIDLGRLQSDIEALARIGRLPGGGISRPAFSPAHEEARAWLVERFRAAGLETRVDPAGNILGRLEGRDGAAPSVMTGSHIDTVPRGGPLDGALGVLAGLECLRAVAASGRRPARSLEVVAFTDEEGRFYAFLGSRALTGSLDPALARRLTDPEGQLLSAAMEKAGFDLERAVEARRPAGSIGAYVELHIEQGPWLEAEGTPVGVVEAIVGIRRWRLTFVGQPDHAGTTPMDRRRDAFLAAAEHAVKARSLVVRAGEGRSVTTFGVVQVIPGVANIVPERTVMIQELRDADPGRLDRLARRNLSLARRVARRHRIELEVADLVRAEPVQLSPRIQAVVEAAAAGRGLPTRRMPSGAGHDAQILAMVTEAGMIFVPSQGGRSHRPDEWTDWPALEVGANVLLDALWSLAEGARDA
jgi:N-carbamoyl-L-amino-acid hydrolase